MQTYCSLMRVFLVDFLNVSIISFWSSASFFRILIFYFKLFMSDSLASSWCPIFSLLFLIEGYYLLFSIFIILSIILKNLTVKLRIHFYFAQVSAILINLNFITFNYIKMNKLEKQEENHNNLLSYTSHHIGIKSTKLYSNIYGIITIPFAPNKHLVVNHGQSLLLYSSDTNHITPSVQHYSHSSYYIKGTFSTKWRIIFLLDNHQNLSIFSFDDLVLLAENIEIKSIRHCLDFIYMDEYSAFLIITPESLKLVYVEIVSNHLRSLFKNAFKFQIRQTQVRSLKSRYFLPYCRKIARYGDYILIYNSDSVKIIYHKLDKSFNSRETKQQEDLRLFTQGLIQLVSDPSKAPSSKYLKSTIVTINKICELPQQITEVFFDPYQTILVCGCNQGDIKVFKMNVKNILATVSVTSKQNQVVFNGKNQLSFKLTLHNGKQINCIRMYSSKLILTFGGDQYVQVVSLQQMGSIEKFKSSSNLANAVFVSNSTFIAIKTIEFDQFLYSYEVSIQHQLVTQHNSQISHLIFKQNKGIMVLTDNSVNILEVGDQKAKQQKRDIQQKNKNIFDFLSLKKEPVSIIPKQSFIPPRCKSILSVQTNMYYNGGLDGQEFWLLTDQSEIYRYIAKKQEKDKKATKFQIIEVIEMQYFRDKYEHETKQKILFMKFIDIVPLYFDSDIKQKKYEANFSNPLDVKPIAFGCETGQILICSSNQPLSIISRIRFFGDPVKAITACYYPDLQLERKIDASQKQQNKKDASYKKRLLLYSSEIEIVGVMISNYEIPQQIYKILVKQAKFFIKQLSPILSGVIIQKNIKILFPCYWLENPKLRLWSPSNMIHQTNITCIEYCGGIKMISGDQGGKIVVWDLRSNILNVIVVSQKISVELAYCWDKKIMFGYDAKIYQMVIEEQEEDQQLATLIWNKVWVTQNCKILSLSSNIIDKNNELAKVSSKQLQGAKQLEKVEENQSQKKINNSRQVDLYLNQMKKTMVKLSHQIQTQNPDQVQKSEGRNEKAKDKRHKKAWSTSKYQPSPHSLYEGYEDDLKNTKILRAVGILQKFKQSQQKQYSSPNMEFANDFSLPQLPNSKKNITIQHQELEISQKRKKSQSKNKKYQYLFHFPNVGLYTQLISKNILK